MRRFFLFLFFLCFSFVLLGQAYESVPGMQNETLTRVKLDTEGNLLFSTLRGMFRYDGTTVVPLYTERNVLDFFCEGDGTLWMTTQNSIVKMNPDGKIDIIEGVYYQSHWAYLYRTLFDMDSKSVLYSTMSGLHVLDKSTMKNQFEHQFKDSGQPSAILYDKSKGLVYSLDVDCLTVFDRHLDFLRQYKLSSIPETRSIAVCPDGGVFLGTDTGLFRLSEEGTISSVGGFEGFKILFLSEIEGDELLVGAKGKGIFRFGSGGCHQCFPEERLRMDKCLGFLAGGRYLWLSPDNTGLYLGVLDDNESDNSPLDVLSRKMERRRISCISESEDGRIWLLVDRRLVTFDKKTSVIESPLMLLDGTEDIDAFLLTTDNHLWVAHRSGIEEFEIRKDRLLPAFNTDAGTEIRYMRQDIDGSVLFVTSMNEAFRYDNVKGFQSEESSLLPSYIDSEGQTVINLNYWNSDSTVLADHSHEEDDSFEKSTSDSTGVLSLTAVCLDHRQRLWYITDMNTLHRIVIKGGKPIENKVFSLADPGQDQSLLGVFSLQEDSLGAMWLGTSSGLIRIDANDNIRYFNSGRKFDYYTASLRDSEGFLYFAYSNGLTIFDPRHLDGLVNTFKTPFSIPVVNINNHLVARIDTKGRFVSLDGTYSGVPLKLKYSENNLSFVLSYLDFDHLQIPFNYKLEGYDREWNYTRKSEVQYSHLPSGTYSFKVKLAKMPDSFSKTVSFRIAPAPWRSTIAYLLYILLAAGLASAAFFRARSFQRSRQLKTEQTFREKMNKMKIDLFVNLAHEFRTPLTLVRAPLKEIEAQEDLSPEGMRKMSILNRNLDKLQLLTSQMLEYNDIDRYDSSLNLTEQDLAAFLRETAENFSFKARESSSEIKVGGLVSCFCLFDKIKVGRVLSNLLSNSIKYSPDGGTIEINSARLSSQDARAEYGILPVEGDYVEVKVLDEGIGIPEGQLESVFGRYSRGVGPDSDISGYGIGLSYARDLVTMHKGAIKAEHRRPKGSVFSFIIPLSKDAYAESAHSEDSVKERISIERSETPVDSPSRKTDACETSALKDDSSRRTLLLVEDDNEMRDYLSGLLCSDYEIVTATNGKEGLAKLRERFPDLVVSDLQMPVMNGWEMCAAIRADEVFLGIPIVLLTAFNDTASRITGLDLGADAYLGKPFEPSELKAVLRNLLANQLRRQKILIRSTVSTIDEDKVSDAIGNPKDKSFLEKLYGLLEDHVSESEINVSYLYKDLGMSRTGFYYKVKELTGKSPIQLIGEYRMSKAVELMKTGQYSLKEISFMVGYEARQSFARSFHNSFGCSATEYLKKLNG